MGRRIGAEEEFGAAGGGHADQRLPVGFALEHGQAVVMRTHATGEDGVAVVEQVVGGDGGAHVRPGFGHELRRFGRGDVLEDNAQGRVARCNRRQYAIDKDALAIKDINVSMGYLAMNTENDARSAIRSSTG